MPADTKIVQRERLVGIQYLRGFAALMVAYFHLTGQLPAYGHFLTSHAWINTDHMANGVDIFFVISGFVMVLTSRRATSAQFVARRALRIVPLYWLMTLAVIAVAIAAPRILRTTHVTLSAALQSLLFIPYAKPGEHGALEPLLVPGWTLNLEMYFYAIFAFTLLPWLRTWQGYICAVLFPALLLIGSLAGADHPILAFYTQPRIAEFFVGMCIAYAWQSGYLRGRARVALIGGAAGIALLLTNAIDSWLVSAASAALIVAGALLLERRHLMPQIAILGVLGDASYSIYLTHIFTLGVMRSIWVRAGLLVSDSEHAAAFALVSIAAVAVAGVAVYQLLEKPILNYVMFRMKQYQRKPVLPSMPQAAAASCPPASFADR